ncbi:(Fe-S)-binding protein [Portibacter marinus]|uniref:(Fe-S)-binding protein n=1 Tax=Portibacter marinus TaxID=2898660 RepID=UPI001F28D825|nr:(Fe-S)-binding protein [Portibacter marinus]
MGLEQVIFVMITLVAFYFAYKQFSKLRANVFLGKPDATEGPTGQRWKNVLLVAFGQKKMFKRLIPAVMHLFIYVAFLFTQVELIEILIDGIFGVHRFFAPILGGLYTFIINFIEILSVLAFVATIVFLARRNLLKIPRFVKSEMTWWPKLDANLILIGELVLLIGIFTMNGADVALQKIDPEHYPDTGYLAISSTFSSFIFDGLPKGLLVTLERAGWWLHILTVYAFLNYLPKSKHLHIMFAFPNTYYAKLKPRGEMENMPEIMNEVKSMMGLAPEGEISEEIPEFGANDIFDFSWKNILGAYSCTECGRCTAECPANITGKKLSPRKILMDIRDRVTEVRNNLETGDIKYIAEEKRGEGVKLAPENYDDGKSLFDYITREELHACTTCNACVEACPILIDPLEPILKMRRYEILTESAGPAEWTPMFTAIENGGAVWQVPDDRDAWTREG